MKFKNFLLILLLLLLFSCVVEKPIYDDVYQIKNSTNYEITLRFFSATNGVVEFRDEILIQNTIYKGESTFRRSDNIINNPNNSQPSISFLAFRVLVVFNGERKMVRSIVDYIDGNNIFSSPIERNLLRGGNYTNIGNDTYEFVLTQEDYDNATPCSGNCFD